MSLLEKFGIPSGTDVRDKYVYIPCDPVSDAELTEIFTRPFHECDIDGHEVMSSTIRRFRVYAILSDAGMIMSYCVTEPTIGGHARLIDIRTYSEYSGNNLAVTILYALRTKVVVGLLFDQYCNLSPSATNILVSAIQNNRFQAYNTSTNTKLLNAEFEEMIKYGFTDEVIIRGQKIHSRFKSDVVDGMFDQFWHLRDTTEKYDD